MWKKAITHFKVIKESVSNNFSLVECKLETWRMHQIRVHLSSVWHPIIWDNIYWNKKENSFLQKKYWINRQLLHAYKISFIHPIKKIKLTFEAKLKEDMDKFLISNFKLFKWRLNFLIYS